VESLPPPRLESLPPPVPRRKFVRPAGIAAQQLNSTLEQIFETAAAAPAPPADNGQSYQNGNGHHPVSFPVSHETTTVPASQPPQSWPPVPAPVLTKVNPGTASVPAWRPPAEKPYSPFAISEDPLTPPPAAPPAPAPFTFLKNDGEHFAPAVEAPPVADPLDDTLLPWTQPARGRS
jgi:hypothetical protein